MFIISAFSFATFSDADLSFGTLLANFPAPTLENGAAVANLDAFLAVSSAIFFSADESVNSFEITSCAFSFATGSLSVLESTEGAIFSSACLAILLEAFFASFALAVPTGFADSKNAILSFTNPSFISGVFCSDIEFA